MSFTSWSMYDSTVIELVPNAQHHLTVWTQAVLLDKTLRFSFTFDMRSTETFPIKHIKEFCLLHQAYRNLIPPRFSRTWRVMESYVLWNAHKHLLYSLKPFSTSVQLWSVCLHLTFCCNHCFCRRFRSPEWGRGLFAGCCFVDLF